MKEKITQPVERLPLYICGEVYSDARGWIEGALQAAEMMTGKVIEKFGVNNFNPKRLSQKSETASFYSDT